MLTYGITDLWLDEEPCEQHIHRWAQKHHMTWDAESPDILFYACGGESHLTSQAMVKVCWVQENVFPNFNVCDYAISHVRDSLCGRNLYFPYAMEVLQEPFMPPQPTPDDAHRPFGIFIASQDYMGAGAALRREFTQYLSTHYKRVDCPGKVLNNISIPELGARKTNTWNECKRSVINRYKFLVSFENTNTDGYITEKLVDAFAANTVPIYWGSEGNLAPFPKEAVICANDYPDFDSLMERIREVDTHDELYLSILEANPLRQPEFWHIVGEYHTRRQAFLDKIHAAAQAYQQGTQCPPDRGMLEFDLAGRMLKAHTTPCPPIRKNRTPFHAWWRSTAHLHFIQPWKAKPHIPCPYHSLLHDKGREIHPH